MKNKRFPAWAILLIILGGILQIVLIVALVVDSNSPVFSEWYEYYEDYPQIEVETEAVPAE